MEDVKSKKIIVIGGSSGIGKAVAQQLARMGSSVVITSRSLSKAQKALEEMKGDIVARQLDVDEEEQVNTFFSEFTEIDHIYVAAGSTALGSLTGGVLSEHLSGFHTRVQGSLRIVRAAINKVNPGGSVTFTGGISTDRPIAGAWVSGLGTATVEQLARVLVMEFPHIRFNAVSPGYTDTPLWDTVLGESKREVLAGVAARLPTQKIATADEVASAVVFLMSNGAVTGEVLHVDGGGRLI